MKKILLFTLLFFYTNASSFEFKLDKTTLYNAQTLLIQYEKKNDISDIKLSFNKLNINFSKNPFKKDSYYALLPISYYTKFQDHKIIFSYLKNSKRIFKARTIKVIEGKYKKEQIKVSSKRVSLNKKDKKRSQKEYQEAYKFYNTNSKNILWQEDFLKPINSKITSEFGTKRLYNKSLKSYHSGLDFKAKLNTKIRASNAGKVVISQNRFYAGNSIVIDHGHGVYTGYYHLNKLLKKKGAFVKKGEVVGLSGKTGRVTGPHLHFSTKVHGINVDPLQLLENLNKLKL